MQGNKLRGPIVACALLGVVCVSSIAYYFYNRRKKKSLLERLKEAYIGEHGFFENDDPVEPEESYDLPEPSEYADYLIVQATNQDNQVTDRSLDNGSKYDQFEEVAYIEDDTNDSAVNKGYLILASPTLSKSRQSPPNDAQTTLSTRSTDTSKKGKSDEWTLIDNYTNVDGNAEELVYVESTNHTFSEKVDVQKDKSVPLECEEIEVSSEIVDSSDSKKGFIEGDLFIDPVAEEVPEKVADDDIDEMPEIIPEEEAEQVPELILDDDVEESTDKSPEKNIYEIPEKVIDDDAEELPEEVEDEESEEIPEESAEEEADEDVEESSDEHLNGGVLEQANNPESTKIYFKSFGCSHNISDGEYMMGMLVEYGYKIVETMEESQLVIINSCTVKGPSEDTMISFIKAASALNLPIIVSGCVPQADNNNPAFDSPRISLLGITQIDRIVEMVENSLQGNKMVLLEKKDLPQLDIPKIRRNKLIEIIPLSTGCLGSCTFCKTKHSRGVLGSYDVEVILDRVENCIKDGVKEIWLTSEDLGAYGIDLGTNLVTLLRSIIQVLPPDTMLRLGMSNPPYIKKYIDEICQILLHDNVYEFIHIPVQSCSNPVLKDMNREYKVEEFLNLVETIRKKVPNCTIATDIISGFPTETQEDHLITRTMLQELKLPIINISQYYARQGTIASRMKQLPGKVRKGRTRDITNMFMSYETNSKYLNQVIKVYFNQINYHCQLVGHDKHYIKVILVLQARHPTKPIEKKKIKPKVRKGLDALMIKNVTNGTTNCAKCNGGKNGIVNGSTNGINGVTSNGVNNENTNNGITNGTSNGTLNCNGNIVSHGSINDNGIDYDSSDSYSDFLLDPTPVITQNDTLSTTDTRYLTNKYFGTVQNVKIIKTTKWHLEGIIV